jgi:hypothetical protein
MSLFSFLHGIIKFMRRGWKEREESNSGGVGKRANFKETGKLQAEKLK